IQRRTYPDYEHIAVIIAESITTRFLNVMALLAGSVPLIAIQLDALAVGDQLLLHFTHILDQKRLRRDDTDNEGGGGGQVDRAFWEKKAGVTLMGICDEVIKLINATATPRQEASFLRQYIGLQSQGLVDNFIFMSPKPSKNFVHINFRNASAVAWVDKVEQAGVPVRSRQEDRLRVTVTPEEFSTHRDLIAALIADTVVQQSKLD
ncbi:MAG TPA: hypothetical protein VF175_19785, partial [Lacipirellula sp.]